ncbi:MAG: DUF1858 domain-containing protein [Defluviitaleaceae bacterium]|nr:DUF1858 domain-containing protein [Defluviitaleaceae bacterium]
MAKVTKDMLISDILKIDMGIAPILLNAGMNCVGCPGAARETLDAAATGHGADPDVLADEINAYLESVG